MRHFHISARCPVHRTSICSIPPLIAAISFILLFCLASSSQASSRQSVLETIEHAQEPYDSSVIESVQPVSGKTVMSRERDQRGTFRVLARKDQITRYRCSSCHTTEKPQLEVRSGAVLTHGDIQLNHGKAASLVCIDCHHPDERDYLEDKKGNKIDFDHSYQLCGQCHFRQKSDWLGGAHGKRATYWAGERVVFNCTTCHNPHSPKFAKRYPAIYSPPVTPREIGTTPKM